MTIQEVDVHVTAQGEVPAAARQYATDKIAQLSRYAGQPILFAEVKLRTEQNPAHERPAQAEATLDVNGDPVRAHVAAHDLNEAIDLLEERLRRRLKRHHDHRADKLHRSATGNSNQWRHGDQRANRPPYAERPVDERSIIRHKTFALEPISIDEAAFDLEMLGHDFYLFTELSTGVDGVLAHTEAGRLAWIPARGSATLPANVAAPVDVAGNLPAELSLDDAMERLEVAGERFVFFVNAETGRGNVVYRRFDGHYGLIMPA
ncbi:MAG: ribosome-associated translation inhibitor RaiA [Acidimicrobiales bacterium]|nr:ribosome-associated translation inhibitor RaiA [Acidimicrobiales bacterium]